MGCGSSRQHFVEKREAALESAAAAFGTPAPEGFLEFAVVGSLKARGCDFVEIGPSASGHYTLKRDDGGQTPSAAWRVCTQPPQLRPSPQDWSAYATRVKVTASGMVSAHSGAGVRVKVSASGLPDLEVTKQHGRVSVAGRVSSSDTSGVSLAQSQGSHVVSLVAAGQEVGMLAALPTQDWALRVRSSLSEAERLRVLLALLATHPLTPIPWMRQQVPEAARALKVRPAGPPTGAAPGTASDQPASPEPAFVFAGFENYGESGWHGGGWSCGGGPGDGLFNSGGGFGDGSLSDELDRFAMKINFRGGGAGGAAG